MDVARQIEFWRTSSAEDLEVAGELAAKERYRHALFFAEMALEKILEALVVRRTAQVPPRTHDLLRLAERAEIEMEE